MDLEMEMYLHLEVASYVQVGETMRHDPIHSFIFGRVSFSSVPPQR
jgi:hypothetical protein